MIIFSRIAIKSIIVLIGAIMLLSCKNDLDQVKSLVKEEVRPEMTGTDLVMIYSDSARIKYKVLTPEYLKMSKEDKKFEEFPKGIHVVSYDDTGKEMGSVRSKYAKKLEEEMLWEVRDEVVVINNEGTKLETELLYWDMKNEKIYTDRYVRLTNKENVIEGNNGLESDQNLHSPVLKNNTGEIEFEMKKETR